MVTDRLKTGSLGFLGLGVGHLRGQIMTLQSGRSPLHSQAGRILDSPYSAGACLIANTHHGHHDLGPFRVLSRATIWVGQRVVIEVGPGRSGGGTITGGWMARWASLVSRREVVGRSR